MTTTAVPRDKQTLLDKADACDRQAAALDPEQPGADRAREMLTTAAAHLRRAATVYDLDPTLADEPHGVRDVDLLVEFGRQMPPLLRNCLSEKNLDRWPRQGRWDEAEALFARLGGAAGRLIREVPRRDHATVLDALVPMTIHSMAGMDHADRMAMADVDAITGHADVLIAGGTSEPGVDPMAALVRGLAVCAHAPGGVTVYGRHWCAEAHEGCPNGTRSKHWGC